MPLGWFDHLPVLHIPPRGLAPNSAVDSLDGGKGDELVLHKLEPGSGVVRGDAGR